MEVLYNSKKVGAGQFQIKLVSETETGLIEQLVNFQNLFEKNNVCGNCNSEDVSWNIRKTKKGKYYEKKCNKCFYALPYHLYTPEVKNGGMYYSWKEKWVKYDPNADKDDEDEKVFTEKTPTKKGK